MSASKMLQPKCQRRTLIREKLFLNVSSCTLKNKSKQCMLFPNSYPLGTIFSFFELTVNFRYGYDKMAGFSSWRDYTVVEELGVGVNKFLLSSEGVLQAPPANAAHRPPELFNNISLIANCHKKEISHKQGKGYTVQPKKVVFYPVHALLRTQMDDQKEIIQTFETFNEAIWEGLKEGNVFVHCLAGVHRAAAVAVSHYLWRYYKLGHKHLSSDVNGIYDSLAKRRPGVAPLSYITLVRIWEDHLKKSTQEQ